MSETSPNTSSPVRLMEKTLHRLIAWTPFPPPLCLNIEAGANAEDLLFLDHMAGTVASVNVKTGGCEGGLEVVQGFFHQPSEANAPR